jgi:hypothetical protein
MLIAVPVQFVPMQQRLGDGAGCGVHVRPAAQVPMVSQRQPCCPTMHVELTPVCVVEVAVVLPVVVMVVTEPLLPVVVVTTEEEVPPLPLMTVV